MLDIQVRVQGDRVVIDGLNRIAAGTPKAITRGLERVAKGVHREARGLLSGQGLKGTYAPTKSGKMRWKKREQPVASGGYPVPVRTGHLRRCLDWLKPGESKTGETGTFTAGPNEVVIFDHAQYGQVIHEGKGSSAKFGPRPYLTDAFQRFNSGGRIAEILNEEISRELK